MKLSVILTVASAKLVQPDEDGTYRIKYNHSSNQFRFRKLNSETELKSIFSWTVLGDWGGWPAPQFTSPIQLSVADSMKRVSRLNPPEYIIGLGDNFYFHGVEDDEDEMWEKTFEQVRII